MKSNVSKFLVKSILSTAFAATATSGYVNGMEIVNCNICLEPPGTHGDIVTLHENLQNHNKEHKFCSGCLKKWLRNAIGHKQNKCPYCMCPLNQDELDQFATKLTDEMIKLKIKRWNELIRNNGNLSFRELENRCQIRWFLDLKDKEQYEIEEGYYNDLRAEISDLPEDTQYAYDNEKQFVNSGLGFCGHCYTIMKSPSTLYTRAKESGLSSYSKDSETCYNCDTKNLRVVPYDSDDEYSEDDIPSAFLTVIDEQ